ncbi:hypothetical protein ACET3Z_011531 [Daucus carota]
MCVKHLKPRIYYLHPISLIITIHLVLLINIPVYDAQVDYGKYYSECSKNATFRCGETKLEYIYYPFWGKNVRPSYCGLEGFELTCENNETPVIDIGSGNKYRVAHIYLLAGEIILNRYAHKLEETCAPKFSTSTLNTKLFKYGPGTEDFYMFYGCPLKLHVPLKLGIPNNFTCRTREKRTQVIFGVESHLKGYLHRLNRSCKPPIRVPVNWTDLENLPTNVNLLLQRLSEQNFAVHYKINETACSRDCWGADTGRVCWNGAEVGVNSSCLSKPVKPSKQVKPGNNTGKKIRIVGVAVGTSGGVMLLLLLVIFILYRRRKAKHGPSGISPNVSFNSSTMSDFGKEGTCMGVPTFSYSELEKATNFFDSGNELGTGGFGTVYKGKLTDGREVAVKRLYENNFKRVEQFMNEIVILAGLHHPNLVVLYGSTSHQCRKLLLVYEYIPNGTVADHLHGDSAQPGSLSWKTRLSIAIETASALSYLHASDVIHRDVKTTNILLDSSFRVKVADFGLSRLFPTNVTHVSTVPQGTPGYVDPEYHQCYQLTDKSDVYSFGVVLIELISSMPAVDISRHRHEINLAKLAMNKIQADALHELVDTTLGFESDGEVRNMIADVAELAFRCLQSERDMRPSMEEVHKSLKEIQGKY